MENKLEQSIVEYLKVCNGATSVDIAERFLKFNSPNEQMANIPVTAVLKGVGGVFKNSEGLWCFDKSFQIKLTNSLLNQSWAIVSIIKTNDGNPLCISVSGIDNAIDSKVFWMMDPEGLDEDLQVVLRSDKDNEFISQDDSVVKVYKELNGKIVISASYKDQGLLARLLARFSFNLPDETYLLSNFTKVLDMKSLDINKLYEHFYGEYPVISSAINQGNTFSAVIRSLIKKLESSGIKNLAELTSLEVKKKLIANWTFLNKSVEDIIKQDTLPGVYGFTDKDGKYLYIGKAKNLQRRLLSYFRISDESPAKLKQLRESAHDLTIYRCGSELESLLYEQRLINKYQPALNRKIDINERVGEYKYLEDVIIFLPHSCKEKVVSFWVKSGEKVKLLPLSIDDFNAKLESELQIFYYGDKLPAENTDFQELEIVNRWVKQNEDGLISIEVKRYKNCTELKNQILEEFKSMLRE